MKHIKLNKEQLKDLREMGAGLNLDYCNANGADLHKGSMPDVHMLGALLREVNFNRSDMRGAYLLEADLTKSTFNETDLTGAEMSGVKAQFADFGFAQMSGVDMYGSDMQSTNFYGADLRGATAAHVDFSNAEMVGVDFEGADLGGGHFQRREFVQGESPQHRSPVCGSQGRESRRCRPDRCEDNLHGDPPVGRRDKFFLQP